MAGRLRSHWECWFCGASESEGFSQYGENAHDMAECHRVMAKRQMEAIETIAGYCEAFVKHMGVVR